MLRPAWHRKPTGFTMNNPQLWQAIAAVIAAYAALLGGLYAIVTRPMMARMDAIQGQIAEIIRRLERIEAAFAGPAPGRGREKAA